ncbi:hypothetical protein BIV60_02340 [Bacillus sp. MUM 116]|nr:hypothetical protein BIV60_02340 [Bacillus sp. MUM 116]
MEKFNANLIVLSGAILQEEGRLFFKKKDCEILYFNYRGSLVEQSSLAFIQQSGHLMELDS